MRVLITISFLIFSSFGFSQVQNATFNVVPTTFSVDDEITITVSNIDPGLWGETDIYLWAWYFDLNDNPAGDSPTNGSWENSSESQKFTNNGNGTYSYTLVPQDFYGDTQIGRIGMLAKAKNGSNMGNGERKTQDHFVEVGSFQLEITSPSNPNTIVAPGSTLPISASTSVPTNFRLFANGSVIHTQNNSASFFHTLPINEDTFFEIEATEISSGNILTASFNVILTPNPQELAVPSGMQDGINWDSAQPNEITLVLHAPDKEFVHLIGNFNNSDWRLTNAHLLNKDPNTDRHWITLENFSRGNQHLLFQYLIDAEITVADPYSTQIITEFNDVFIEPTTFPNIPSYPIGKTEHAISWVNLQEPTYTWNIPNFTRPSQDNLVVYELLIRDFDAAHSFDAVTNRLDYLENLGVNAIELMPVNEFDGNISWGYNPSFHMALDKYYGTRNAFKAFVDACHARGIAVILDVVYNHATGQNPLYRMWNSCNGCYGGNATANNPYFNETDPNTVFQFFNDMDHESTATQNYIDRLNQFWLEEYNIDGFRFDFTKGFTNTVGDGGSYDASRIALLQRMYNEIRNIDPTAYVILEHFAPNNEETELITHRASGNPNEPGMLIWGNHNFNYNEATMGYHAGGNSDFSWISYQARGWDNPAILGYMESHDEERLMYKNLAFGNSQGAYNIQNLNTALERLQLAGAFFFTIPGPKMIWQFGELGYDFSINYCENGTINSSCRVDPKPIAWNENYHTIPERQAIYNTWKQLITYKLNAPIFSTLNFSLNLNSTDGLKTIHLEDPNAMGDDVRYVTIIGNFGVSTQNITPNFQETGSWFDMLTGEEITVTQTTNPISLAAGDFKVYANESSFLGVSSPEVFPKLTLYPNPSAKGFALNQNADELRIFSATGVLVYTLSDYTKSTLLDMATLANGLYFIEIDTQNTRTTLKWLKQ